MPYANMNDRNYAHERQYDSRPEVMKRRAERKKARRLMEKYLGRNLPADVDVDHITPLTQGGKTEINNLRIVAASKNRSYDRNADHSVKSNTPPPNAKS